MAALKFTKVIFLNIFILFLASSCATYYQKNMEFNKNFVSGNIDKANKILDKDKKADKKKTKLLYYFNKGVVEQMLGNYAVSNDFFEKAYISSEDYQKNYVNEAVSFLSNPNFVKYNGESHELLMIHYYKAINYNTCATFVSKFVVKSKSASIWIFPVITENSMLHGENCLQPIFTEL